MIAYRYKDLRAARYWLAGSTAGVAGGITLSLQGESGLIVDTVGGNGFIILGFYMNLCGSRLFHGDKVQWTPTAFLAVSSIAVILAAFHAWYGHNPVYTLTQSLLLGLTAIYLLRAHRGDLGAMIDCWFPRGTEPLNGIHRSMALQKTAGSWPSTASKSISR